MREIKFRAWDAEHKKMRGHTDPQTIQAVIFGNDYGGRIEIMQYTGLKDKNGKEIYEGDIAILPDRWPKFPVRYIDGMFCLEGTSWPLHEYYEECEIIGNIYENPELL